MLILILTTSLYPLIDSFQAESVHLSANAAMHARGLAMERGVFSVESSSSLPYIGESLAVFKTRPLYLFSNAFANFTSNIIRFRTVGEYFPYIEGLSHIIVNYLPLTDSCGNLTSVERYYNETYDVIILNVTYTYCRLSWTTLGYIYFAYQDGVVHNLYVLNETQLNNTINHLLKFVYYYYVRTALSPGALNSWGIFYAGVSADEVVREVRQEFLVVNGTLTPVTSEYVRLVNPYYKFYMVFEGVRFAYPIMIGIEDVDGKPVLKFLKLVLPAQTHLAPDAEFGWIVIRKEFKVRDNYTYIDLIALKVREILNNTDITENDIIIADIYYDYTPDFRHLYPYLVVYVNATEGFKEVIRFRLTPKEPVVDAVYLVAGLPSPSDPSYLLIESMLATRQKCTICTISCCVIEIDATPMILSVIIIFASLIALTAILSRIESRRARKA